MKANNVIQCRRINNLKTACEAKQEHTQIFVSPLQPSQPQKIQPAVWYPCGMPMASWCCLFSLSESQEAANDEAAMSNTVKDRILRYSVICLTKDDFQSVKIKKE